jgi:hypothetical protein
MNFKINTIPSPGSKETTIRTLPKFRSEVDRDDDSTSDHNEVDLDTLEIAHEGLTIKDAL